jgi:transcriptional antiterminator RfaH
MFWACARTQPQRERVAQNFLGQFGFETYLPRVRGVRYSHGRRIQVKPPLFPCYLFVAITSTWWSVKSAPGVSSLVMLDGAPARVPDHVIDEIRLREVDGLIDLAEPRPFQRGDHVRVLRGPFTGHLAIFADMWPRERVEILLQLLGGEQRVTLAKKDIEVVRRRHFDPPDFGHHGDHSKYH